MNLEYVIAKASTEGKSYAIKAHRRSHQNPAIRFNHDGTEWTITGLQRGKDEAGQSDDVDHLDIYLFIDDLRDQLAVIPLQAAAPVLLPTTTNWGKEGNGKKLTK